MIEEADTVVVGAGSAGCVVAERLSRDGRHRVAVIEAGPSDRSFWIQVPLGYGRTFYDPRVNWMYRAEPDPGLGGRADYWPRGKVVGGSGSINAMLWVRGDPSDYDDWAAAGNPGWSHANVLPTFKAIEHNEAGADDHRAVGGPMHVTDLQRRLHPLARRFLAAAGDIGLPACRDFNGASQEGVGVYQINTRNGWRHSSAKAYLRPALRRDNLVVLTGATVVRIVMEGARAVGVEIRRDGETRIVRARCAVILAAGAVGSPHVLHHSGIGPGAELAAHGVPVHVDRPGVGRNLQDHVGVNYLYRARIPTLNGLLRPWWGKLAAGAAFLVADRGPLAMSLNQAGGFVRTRPGLNRPNIQLYCQAITTSTARAGTRPLFTPDPFPGFAIGLSNCRPTSRGFIALRSPDPSVPPRIVPNALSTAEDIAEAVEGVKLLRRLVAAPALADIVVEELAPGPSAVDDAALEADFRARCGTVYHPVGTCAMGPDPARAVVDPRLRVHGVDALRVIDASVFPTIVSGNTNAPTIMVAAKGAEMAVEDAR